MVCERSTFPRLHLLIYISQVFSTVDSENKEKGGVHVIRSGERRSRKRNASLGLTPFYTLLETSPKRSSFLFSRENGDRRAQTLNCLCAVCSLGFTGGASSPPFYGAKYAALSVCVLWVAFTTPPQLS